MTATPLFRRPGFRQDARDDRGNTFKPFKHARLGEVIETGARRHFALKTRLRRVGECDRPPPPGRRTNPQVWITIGAIAIIALLISAVAWADIGELVVPTILLVVVAAAVLASLFRQGDIDTITANTLVAEGICGCCGFSLHGLSPEQDGCIVCPECGHAFDALRIVRPLWEPGDESMKTKDDPRPDIRAGFRRNRSGRWTPDDCGRCVHTPHPRLRGLDDTISGQICETQRSAIVADIRRPGRLSRRLTSIAGAGAFAIAAAWSLVVFPQRPSSGGEFIFAALVVGPGLIVSLLIPFSSMGIRPHRVAAVLTARGRCGSCARDLRDEPPNANAMRVCPLCRASWL